MSLITVVAMISGRSSLSLTAFVVVCERLCVKVVSTRSERGLIEYAPFLLSALVKGSQTTLHTASEK